MASGKERKRVWMQKIRADPSAHAEYLRKERERYRKRKEEGKIKPISNLTEREQRQQRKNWRRNQRYKRAQSKIMKKVITPPVTPEGTPPNSSPESAAEVSDHDATSRENPMRPLRRLEVLLESERKKSGSYKERSDKYKRRSDDYKKKMNKYRMRLNRAQSEETENKTPSTPESKARFILRQNHSKIRKCLTVHNAVNECIKTKMAPKEKKLLIKRSTKVLKKYRLLRFAEKEGILSRHCLYRKQAANRKAKRDSFARKIKEFYLRDDNSTLTAGKKQTITRQKEKKQLRFLEDTMSNLHAKFNAENDSTTKVSYATFTRYRPFWVRQAKTHDNCLCEKHQNIELKLKALNKIGVLNIQQPELLIKEMVCNNGTSDKRCMYGECEKCQNSKLPTTSYNRKLVGTIVEYEEWEKQEKGTVKVKKEMNIENLIEEIETFIKTKFLRHLYNIRHQYRELTQIKENLQERDVLLHIDFSENWACKYNKEIQAMHFGFRSTATLHTGINII